MPDEIKRKRWEGQKEWDKKNIASLGCKVRTEEAAAFKDYASKRGKTVNTVLKEFVIRCISGDEEKNQ